MSSIKHQTARYKHIYASVRMHIEIYGSYVRTLLLYLRMSHLHVQGVAVYVLSPIVLLHALLPCRVLMDLRGRLASLDPLDLPAQ